MYYEVGASQAVHRVADREPNSKLGKIVHTDLERHCYDYVTVPGLNHQTGQQLPAPSKSAVANHNANGNAQVRFDDGPFENWGDGDDPQPSILDLRVTRRETARAAAEAAKAAEEAKKWFRRPRKMPKD